MQTVENHPSLQDLIYASHLVKPTEGWVFTVLSPINPWIYIEEMEEQP